MHEIFDHQNVSYIACIVKTKEDFAITQMKLLLATKCFVIHFFIQKSFSLQVHSSMKELMDTLNNVFSNSKVTTYIFM